MRRCLPLSRTAVLSQVKLIAEPWDIAHGGYQVEISPLFADGTIISAMQPVVSGCIMITSGSVCRFAFQRVFVM